MTGEEMKALRQSAGLSQAELATAIGMSRESIGRKERSGDLIEKRTELALRFVAAGGPGATLRQTQEMIRAVVANVLDEAAVTDHPSAKCTDVLKQALADWIAAGGSEPGRQLIYRAQGVIGLLNVTPGSGRRLATDHE